MPFNRKLKSMTGSHYNERYFNQELHIPPDIEDVSSIVAHCPRFNNCIFFEGCTISRAISMYYQCYSFNKPIFIKYDTAMTKECHLFNQPVKSNIKIKDEGCHSMKL